MCLSFHSHTAGTYLIYYHTIVNSSVLTQSMSSLKCYIAFSCLLCIKNATLPSESQWQVVVSCGDMHTTTSGTAKLARQVHARTGAPRIGRMSSGVRQLAVNSTIYSVSIYANMAAC